MDLQLSGLNAIVTGGSKGIGQAVVQAFLKEGANVAFCARNTQGVAQLERDFSSFGPKILGSTVDVADRIALEAWVHNSAQALGGIDIVVCNVSALALDDTEESWHSNLTVDLMHTVRTCKAAIAYLEKSANASIVNISSASALELDGAMGPYSTTKAAIIAYTAYLSTSLASKNIRANTVSPGNTYVKGGILNRMEIEDPLGYAQLLAHNPTGRMGTPEEAAFAVLTLSSPLASRISGTNFVVDGALTRSVQF